MKTLLIAYVQLQKKEIDPPFTIKKYVEKGELVLNS